jgi:hypothetical protein
MMFHLLPIESEKVTRSSQEHHKHRPSRNTLQRMREANKAPERPLSERQHDISQGSSLAYNQIGTSYSHVPHEFIPTHLSRVPKQPKSDSL